MQRLGSVDRSGEPDVFANGYELERQLLIAERRYAEARGAAQKARDEWRTLSAHPGARAELLDAARAKVDAVNARCEKLRRIIEDIEDRLGD